MLRKVVNISVIILILLTIIVTVLTTVSFSSQQITLSIIPDPKIDIALTKSRSTTNISNFKDDILKALEEKGVKTKDIRIIDLEGQNINMQDAFTWQEDISSTIGSITVTEGGQNVIMKGNSSKPGKNAIWIMPEEGQEQEFNFEYNIDFGDSFKAAGMLLRVQEEENLLKGYALSFNKSGKDYYSTSGSNGAIWEFEYIKGTNTSNMTKTLKKSLNISTSGNLNVKVTDAEIIIEGGGLSKTSYVLEEPYGNGFGFFSDHYSHNCSKIGSFTLKNINLNTTIVKKYSEVLRSPDWRENAIKVLVSVEDYTNTELLDDTVLGELLTRLLNENIYFSSWGTEKNQEQIEKLIKDNNGNGIFINNIDYENSIKQTADYIKTLIDGIEQDDQTILLEKPVTLNITPPELANNTADSNYPYGKWKITHDYSYYENPIGQFAQTGQYTENFVTKFNKTGKYTITYADNEITPQQIYVHRMPTAHIERIKNGSDITLITESLDLDSYSTGNRGIVEEEWKYKKTTDTEWTDGKLEFLSDDADYVVQLRVKDYQGVWSYPISIYATNRIEALPIASFGIKNRESTKYEPLEVINTAYDPYGGAIVSQTWEVYNEEEKIYTGESPLTTYDTIGNYTMKLTVTNDRGITSETYSRTFKITEDEIPPEFIAEPLQSEWAEQMAVHIEFTDEGGSGFKSYQYALTNTPKEKPIWSEEIAKSVDDIIIEQEGIKYLHIISIDNANNISEERILGPYKIDRSFPKITYTGELTNIQIDSTDITLQATDDWSGIAEFTLNGQQITNQTYQFTKNGTYTLTAIDNIGHTTTVEMPITNIYYECKAGLEHPIYSSSYDKCPICALIEGMEITEHTHTYNAEKQGVKYTNPQNATIIEYYSETKNNPILVNNYPYELKVVYEEKEYKTGFTGNYKIIPKELNITNIVAQSKVYNGNTKVILSGGNLQGVCKQDEVRFVLPYFGNTEQKNVGTWKVAIEEIALEGEQAKNYTLKQPDHGAVEASITKRMLSVVKLAGKNKIYDGNTTVEIIGGEPAGLIEGDDINFTIPKQGQTQKPNVGIWNVSIEEIKAEGQDAANYTLLQPLEGEIKATISKEEGKLSIGCENKKYDRMPIEPYIVEKNSTSQVEYHYYKSGTTQEIDAPFDVGIYDIIGYMPTDGNYSEATSQKITVEITKPDDPLLKVTSKILEINGKKPIQEEGKNQKVQYNDIIKLQITVENVGKGSGYAQKIIQRIPQGLSFLPEDKINIENGWKKTKEGTIETEKLSIANNIKNELFMQKQEQENEKEEKQSATIEVILKVTDEQKRIATLKNVTELIQQNKRGDTIPYTEEHQKYAKSQINVELCYTDIQIENKIINIIQTNTKLKEEKQYKINQKVGQIVKTEVESKNLGNTQITLQYQINITNVGTEETTVQNITNILPQGTNFQISNNPGWKINKNGNAVYEINEVVKPKQTKTITLQLSYKPNKSNLNLKTNQVIVEAEHELDNVLVKEEKVEIERTNNYATAKIITSIKTGEIAIAYTILAVIILAILITGTMAIKKIVVK